MDSVDFEELYNRKSTVFDITSEEKTIENNDKTKEDFEVYSQEFLSKAKVNSVTAKPFNFDEIADKCEKLTQDGGVMKLLSKRGIGPIVPAFSSVLIKFSAYVEFSDEPFDFCKVPVTIDLGTSMLKGMNVALASMRKAEKASFYLQPHYAYGKLGCIKPLVPPNSTCLFVIEMVEYEEKGGAAEFFDLPPAERGDVPFDVILGIARIKKKEAQRHFKNKDYERAKAIYERMSKDLAKYHPEDDKENFEHKDMLLKMLCNTCLCHLLLRQFDSCLSTASQALLVEPQCAKALYFKAKATFLTGDVEGALVLMLQAHHIVPKDKDINLQLDLINKAVGERKKDQKVVCQKMLNEEGSPDAGQSDHAQDFKSLSEDLREEISLQLNDLKDSEDLSQSISLSRENFSKDELSCICALASSAGLRSYHKDNALVIAKI